MRPRRSVILRDAAKRPLLRMRASPRLSQNQKAGSRPAVSLKCLRSNWVPGRSEAPPGLEGYFLAFFFDFDFFAFFAFFAFLAIASSQGLMEGNATRGMLGGGPASQHPRMQSQQIRGALPRTVTPVSLRYPQMLCILARFRPFDAVCGAKIFTRRARSHRPRRPGGGH